MYPFALIGNCQAAALIDQSATINWLCFPRPDSPPVFGNLLDPDGGFFSIETPLPSTSRQEYFPNTPVLVTTIDCNDGSSFKITDFCPRYYQYGRMYRPNLLIRKIEPLHNSPAIRVRCRPIDGWDKKPVLPIRGNSHLRYDFRNDHLRLASNMPLTYLIDESVFSLKEPVYLGLSWSFGIEEDLVQMAQRDLNQTIEYWELWVKHCSIPTQYQQETIRSAITLKLHCYEDTGAILAALTTSLPEEIGAQRNWDYRFCWLRDAYFVLSAFHNLGHFEEMEDFLHFVLNIAEKHEHSRDRLRPVYRLDQTLPLPENEYSHWKGFQNSAPVRSENQAAEHIQNDVYGEMILTLTPIFFDERFRQLRTSNHEYLLKHLAKLCVRNISEMDSGPWELRNGWQEHSFSNLMCWAGIDRMHRLEAAGILSCSELDLRSARTKAEKALGAAIQSGSLRSGPRDDSFDASLLLLPILRYPDQDLCQKTTREILTHLSMVPDSAFLYRYKRSDDFGRPQSAFLVCSFWLVQALVKIGEMDLARQAMKQTMAGANSLGLFAEHFHVTKKLQTGNFPQAYSHVGQINAAFAISPPWSEVL